MAFARISLSFPLKLAEVLNELVKEKKVSKSELVAELVRKEKRLQDNLELQRQYELLAQDPQYQRESAEWVRLTQDNYARNILSKEPPYER
jgi:metal-responsive CopG/Arc/MetJ family transcriptional regulator